MRSATAFVLIVVSVLLARCRAQPEEAVASPRPDTWLGSPVRAGNLAVWPVLAREFPDIGPFRSLAETQAHDELGIHELEDAEVATLLIENRGDVPILACAGAVFVGGKQDRQLGEDVVIAAHSTVPVRTYCVERSRWSGGRTFVVAGAIASRAVRAAGQYDGDQSGVWQEVSGARASMGLESGSYRAVAEARSENAANVLAHLRAQEGHLVGYAYAIRGKLMGMRIFAHPALLEPRLDAAVHALCMESEQVATAESEERQLIATFYRSSDAYDDADYDIAELLTRKILALDPENEHAKELLRRASATRDVTDEEESRRRFRDEWRTIMAQLETNVFPLPTTPQASVGPPDDLFDNRGDGEYRGRVVNVADVVLEFDETNGTASSPESGLFFADGAEVDLRGTRADQVAGSAVATNGVNRNRIRRTATGCQATCSIRGKDGQWIALTRDWTAR